MLASSLLCNAARPSLPRRQAAHGGAGSGVCHRHTSGDSAGGTPAAEGKGRPSHPRSRRCPLAWLPPAPPALSSPPPSESNTNGVHITFILDIPMSVFVLPPRLGRRSAGRRDGEGGPAIRGAVADVQNETLILLLHVMAVLWSCCLSIPQCLSTQLIGSRFCSERKRGRVGVY